MPMLFQIEEPDGSPLDEAAGPGVAVGIDLSGARGVVAFAVGGNAEVLTARDGSPGPETAGLRDAAGEFALERTGAVLLTLRGIAERALARPVTHAVITITPPADVAARQSLARAAASGDLIATHILTATEAAALVPDAAAAEAAALGAAVAAENDGIAAQRGANP